MPLVIDLACLAAIVAAGVVIAGLIDFIDGV